jgi:hypothetical protein
LCQNILLSTLFTNVFSVFSQRQICTHTKPQAKL